MVKAKKKTKKKARKKEVIASPPKPVRNDKGQLVAGWGRGSKKKKKKPVVTKPKRDATGRLLPGQVLNPAGGSMRECGKLDYLMKAVRAVETERNINLLEHFVERAFDSDNVLIALMKKMHPDLKAIETLTLPADSISDEEAQKWREEMNNRFH